MFGAVERAGRPFACLPNRLIYAGRQGMDVMGPTRRPRSHQSVPGTRERIVTFLRQGPTTVDTLSRETGLTPNGVRAQLAILERDRWVESAGVKRGAGAGKPAVLYQLAPDAEARLSEAYLPMLKALVAALAERDSEARREALFRSAGLKLAEGRAAVGSASFKDRIDAAIDVLAELGGAVSSTTVKRKEALIEGAGCPVGEAVAVDHAVCRAVAALLQGVSGAKVTDICDRTNRPSCRFRLQSPPNAA